MDLTKYTTAHQLARQLLAGPDLLTVIAMPTFDMPGSFTALPVEIKQTKVEDKDCIMISAGRE
jgi:hypothetical protein